MQLTFSSPACDIIELVCTFGVVMTYQVKYKRPYMHWFDSFYVRVSTITAVRSVTYLSPHRDTDERTWVHSAQSSIVVTHPSTNRNQRAVTSVYVPLS